jgi:hypothetical protein
LARRGTIILLCSNALSGTKEAAPKSSDLNPFPHQRELFYQLQTNGKRHGERFNPYLNMVVMDGFFLGNRLAEYKAHLLTEVSTLIHIEIL